MRWYKYFISKNIGVVDVYPIPGAAPSKAPANVRRGKGKVGSLHIVWEVSTKRSLLMMHVQGWQFYLSPCSGYFLG